MAASATAPASRLSQLRKSLDRAMTECRPGTVLTFEPMFRLLKVSRKTLRQWVDEIEGFEQSGCFDRGAEGMKYEFNPVATIWFLIRHFERERDGRSEKGRRGREIMGLSEEVGVPVDATMDDTIKLQTASAKNLDLKVKYGQYTDASKVERLLRRHNGECQSAIFAVEQQMDPVGKRPANERAIISETCRYAVLAVHSLGKKIVGEERESDKSRPLTVAP